MLSSGYEMAYYDFGEGNPIVFLHGNPTSSYLWRNVAPALDNIGRVLVPDLMGTSMGDSSKLDDPTGYRFKDHSRFLDEWFVECVNAVDDVTLVLHDWGSALGFWWAYRNQESINGIAYMEALVQPLTYDHFDPEFEQFFRAVRTPGVGEQMILEDNVFVEQILLASIIRNLSEAEHDE